MNDHEELTPRELEQVEQRLRGAMDARARRSVPDHRLPPPIDWPKEGSGRRAWLTPLAIAASVLVIAGGVTVAATHRASQAPPVTQTGSATVSTPSPTPPISATPSPATTSPATSSPATPSLAAPSTARTGPASGRPTTTPPQGGTSTTVGGATVVVPAGWSIRQDTGSGQSRPINETWCLDPGASTTCTIRFVRLYPAQLDSDLQGGVEVNPEYCGAPSGYAVKKLETYNDLTMGGRAAEYRYWHFVCGDGKVTDVAQYTVVTPTPYLLSSDTATPEIRDLMAGMAASATLPAATSTTRLYDHGIVRTVTPRSDGGATISIDRVIVNWPNQNATTYSYVLPAGTAVTVLSPPGSTVGSPSELVGRTVSIQTDAQVITQVFVY